MSAARTRELGELGVIHDVKPLYFRWFGTRMRVSPGATELVLSEFMEAAGGMALPEGLDPADLAGTFGNLSSEDQVKAQKVLMDAFPMVKNFAKGCIHEDDFPEFWRLALKHGQTSKDLMQVCMQLVDQATEATTGRPTAPPQNSGPTRRRTGPKSKAKSSSRAALFEPASLKVIKRLEKAGRADLAEIHQIRQEALLATR